MNFLFRPFELCVDAAALLLIIMLPLNLLASFYRDCSSYAVTMSFASLLYLYSSSSLRPSERISLDSALLSLSDITISADIYTDGDKLLLGDILLFFVISNC
jgi:hypothetical protein